MNEESYKRFFYDFRDASDQPKYDREIDKLIESNRRSLKVSIIDMQNFETLHGDLQLTQPILFPDVIIGPRKALAEIEKALKSILREKNDEYLKTVKNRVHIRFYDPPPLSIQLKLRELRSAQIGKVIYTEAIITKISEVRPLIEIGRFECLTCHNPIDTYFIDGEYQPPVVCQVPDRDGNICGGKAFKLIKEESEFVDIQRIILQERPEDLPAGRMPESFVSYLQDDLVDTVRPGDRVKIVGILETRAEKKLMRGQMAIFTKYVDTLYIEAESEEASDVAISPEEEQEILELSKDIMIHEKIRESIAPMIFGYTEEKEAISYILFGGTEKKISQGMKIRGESNILLIGDPGVGKSLTYSQEIAYYEDNELKFEKIGEFVDRLLTNNAIKIGDKEIEKLSKDIKVPSISNNFKMELKKINAIIRHEAPDQIIIIKTKTGREIRITKDHSLLKFDGHNILPLRGEDAKIGDIVPLSKKISFREKRTILNINNMFLFEFDSNFGYFLGFFIGDGSLIHQQNTLHIEIGNSDIKKLEKCTLFLKDNVPYKIYTTTRNNSVKYHSLRIDNQGFVNWIAENIYNEQIESPEIKSHKTRLKKINNILLTSNYYFLNGFLCGLLDSDGFVSRKNYAFENINKNVVSALEKTLLLLGISFTKYIKKRIYKEKKFLMHGVRLVHENIFDRIKNVERTPLNIIDRVVVPTSILGPIKDTGLNRNSGNRQLADECRGEIYRGSVGREYTLKMLSNFDNELLKPVAYEDHIYWDKIISIQYIPIKEIEENYQYVYDLSVADNENFLAEGIFVHNSQILRSIAEIVPRKIFTSGRGSSAAGLTAAVSRDPDTNEMTLEAGAVVLADKGFALIDEFDKMRREDRSALHESMEQHTVSIAKAGIIATLNARASIIAAANPREGRWVKDKPPIHNINLPPAIISRFDLIYPMIDEPDQFEDEKKAAHILSIHQQGGVEATPISRDLLRKYIEYARKNIHPVLSPEAKERLLEFYLQLRTRSKEANDANSKVPTIAITPRQLEALVRLSEARAKIGLRENVTREDAERVIQLFKNSYDRIAKDETGNYDVDRALGGVGSHVRNELAHIKDLLDKLSHEHEDGDVEVTDLKTRAIAEGIDPNKFEDLIENLQREGEVYEPRPGILRLSS